MATTPEFNDFYPPERHLTAVPTDAPDVDSPFLDMVNSYAAAAAARLVAQGPELHALRTAAVKVGPERAPSEVARRAERKIAAQKRKLRRAALHAGAGAIAAGVVGFAGYGVGEILEKDSGSDHVYIGEQTAVAQEGESLRDIIYANVEGFDNPDINIQAVVDHVVHDPRNAETFTGSNDELSPSNLGLSEQVYLPLEVTTND